VEYGKILDGVQWHVHVIYYVSLLYYLCLTIIQKLLLQYSKCIINVRIMHTIVPKYNIYFQKKKKKWIGVMV